MFLFIHNIIVTTSIVSVFHGLFYKSVYNTVHRPLEPHGPLTINYEIKTYDQHIFITIQHIKESLPLISVRLHVVRQYSFSLNMCYDITILEPV